MSDIQPQFTDREIVLLEHIDTLTAAIEDAQQELLKWKNRHAVEARAMLEAAINAVWEPGDGYKARYREDK